MEMFDLFLRYGFLVAVGGAGGWIAWALVRLARDKARVGDAPSMSVEE